MPAPIDSASVATCLYQFMQTYATPEGWAWIRQQQEKLQSDPSERTLFLTFSSVPRFIDNTPILLTELQEKAGAPLDESLLISLWTLQQIARIYLLVTFPYKGISQYQVIIARLSETAEIDELVTLYKALSLLPHPEVLVQQATEGIRTNLSLVLDAIALRNPFPTRYLPQDAWNQMVLKAVFMERPLYLIYQAEKRHNSELARILIDFAHERWAAHRSVTPELWRFVAPYLSEAHKKDIQRAIQSSYLLEQQAGLLACANSQEPSFQALPASYPLIEKAIREGQCTWDSIGEALQLEKENQ